MRDAIFSNEKIEKLNAIKLAVKIRIDRYKVR